MPIQRAKPKFSDVKNVSIAASTLPVGSVVQTVPVTEMTATSYTGVDSANPQTLMSGTITPTSASHKILLFGFASIAVLKNGRASSTLPTPTASTPIL